MTTEFAFTPTELQHIADCSLQHHFWRQTEPDLSTMDDALLQSIHHLHASGGPRRLNLPGFLRYFGTLLPADTDTGSLTTAREILATYHRRLRQEWENIVASNETLSLTIALSRQKIQIEATIHRLDKTADGGITVILFIPPNAARLSIHEASIMATAYHALAAAEYPHRRPVRVAYFRLADNTLETIQLTEKTYRANFQRLKTRLQAWLDGEILARPGLHCDACPFKTEGCPLYTTAEDA